MVHSIPEKKDSLAARMLTLCYEYSLNVRGSQTSKIEAVGQQPRDLQIVLLCNRMYIMYYI